MEIRKLETGLPKLVGHMRETGYSERYVRQFEAFARRLVESSPDMAGWDDVLRWADGMSAEGKRKHLRPFVVIARQFVELDVLPRTPESARHARSSARDTICEGFAAVLDDYEASPAAAAKKATTVRGEISNAASFFARLEALGRTRPEEVTEDDVIGVLTNDDGEPAYSTSHVKQVRAVLDGAGEGGLRSLIPMPRNWRKVKDALSDSEARAVADVLSDSESGLSLRDRGIGCLLLYTGMRACDVAALRLDSIDWRHDVIRITQQKTGAPLELPLTTEVGNALFDYVTSERGGSADPHVFICGEWPYGAMLPQSVRNVANRIFDAAGVRCGKGEARGTHLFRRTVATSMLSGGADRAVAASVLGHASAATTDSYMVASVEGLRAHASLDVSRFPVWEG